MGVGAEGKARVIVAQRAGQRLDVHAVLEGQRGEGVSEVVKPDVFRADGLQDLLMGVAEGVRVEHGAGLGRHEQVGTVWVLAVLLYQQLHRPLRDGRYVFGPKLLHSHGGNRLRLHRCQPPDGVDRMGKRPVDESLEGMTHVTCSPLRNCPHIQGEAQEAVEHPRLLPAADPQAQLDRVFRGCHKGIEILAKVLKLRLPAGSEPRQKVPENGGRIEPIVSLERRQRVIQVQQDASGQLTGAGGQHLSGDHQAGFIAATGLAKAETKQSYKYVGVCTVLNTTIATIVVTLLLTIAPGLA